VHGRFKAKSPRVHRAQDAFASARMHPTLPRGETSLRVACCGRWFQAPSWQDQHQQHNRQHNKGERNAKPCPRAVANRASALPCRQHEPHIARHHLGPASAGCRVLLKRAKRPSTASMTWRALAPRLHTRRTPPTIRGPRPRCTRVAALMGGRVHRARARRAADRPLMCSPCTAHLHAKDAHSAKGRWACAAIHTTNPHACRCPPPQAKAKPARGIDPRCSSGARAQSP